MNQMKTKTEKSQDDKSKPEARLLIVDDDVELCGLVAEYLKPEGFLIESVHCGDKGVELALSGNYALIVLDVMLPGTSGFEVLRRIRSESAIPVMMLTARGDDVDRIVGLEIGADDYLPKPFNPRELVARIHAILRRTKREIDASTMTPIGEKIVVADIEVDIGARTVYRNGDTIELTGVEFNLLEMLIRAAGTVVNREDLCRTVLGRRLMPYDRSLDMHISNLRKKLGHKVGDLERIRTVRGVGYVYTIASDADRSPGLQNESDHHKETRSP